MQTSSPVSGHSMRPGQSGRLASTLGHWFWQMISPVSGTVMFLGHLVLSDVAEARPKALTAARTRAPMPSSDMFVIVSFSLVSVGTELLHHRALGRSSCGAWSKAALKVRLDLLLSCARKGSVWVEPSTELLSAARFPLILRPGRIACFVSDPPPGVSASRAFNPQVSSP